MTIVRIVVLSCAFVLTPFSTAQGGGFRWSDHAAPYDFVFGNHIDTHLETALKADGTLQGFLYVVQLDQNHDGVPDTAANGLPIMRHCIMPEHYPNCQVGWQVTATPCIEEINGCTAMFLYHRHDHPVWLIGPRLRSMDGSTFLGGLRQFIPQPGSPGHYHWLTEGTAHGGIPYPSSIARLESLFGVDIRVDPRCNVNEAEALTTGVICPGYFLELRAVAVGRVYRTASGSTWAFHHEGENIPVSPGVDLRTHLNFVTSYEAVSVPTDGVPPDAGGGMGGAGH